jgi:hypothetical protein
MLVTLNWKWHEKNDIGYMNRMASTKAKYFVAKKRTFPKLQGVGQTSLSSSPGVNIWSYNWHANLSKFSFSKDA